MKPIIETAKECGSELFTGSETQGDIWTFTESTITAFADRIRQDERERCAQDALDEMVEVADKTDESYNLACEHIAAAIRARGEKTE